MKHILDTWDPVPTALVQYFKLFAHLKERKQASKANLVICLYTQYVGLMVIALLDDTDPYLPYRY